MKNIINYFYDLKIKEYKKNNEKFIFTINDDEYEFVEYYGDIDNKLKIYTFIKENFKPCHEIILNRNNIAYTIYENKSYILLKKQKQIRSENLFFDIISFSSGIKLRGEINWKKLWSQKLDYYEQKMKEHSKIFKYGFYYYASLCENAINLINFVDIKNLTFGLSHYRIEIEDDLINPLNIIIDSRVRDIAEYVKTLFFKYNKKSIELLDMIKKRIFTKDEMILLLSRMLYPSYFFDECELIYKKNITSSNFENIIKKNLEYENFLKEIYIEINKNYNFPQIEFLELK